MSNQFLVFYWGEVGVFLGPAIFVLPEVSDCVRLFVKANNGGQLIIPDTNLLRDPAAHGGINDDTP